MFSASAIARRPASSSKLVIDAQTHPIHSVTVFRSNKAEVIRAFELELTDGQNEITLSNLPLCMVLDSIRVQGVANATLFDVSTTLPPTNRSGSAISDAEKDKSRELKDLEEREEALMGEKHIRDLQAQVLVKFSQEIDPKDTNPTNIFTYLDDFFDYGKSNLSHIAKIEKELKEIRSKIAEEKEKTPPFASARLRGLKINLLLHAKVAGKAQFTLSYLVSKASWDPVYDLRATTVNGVAANSIHLDFRASIKQSTGEDWKNIVLTLSTALDDQETVIPAMRQLKLHAQTGRVPFHNPLANVEDSFRHGLGFGNASPAALVPSLYGAAPQQKNTGFAAFGQPGGFGSTAAFGSTGAASTGGLFGTAPGPTQAVAPPAPSDEFVVVPDPTDGGDTATSGENPIQSLSEARAVASDNSISASYTVEGLSNIPSDNSPHRVALTELTFEATPRYIAVPKIKKTAYLDCLVTNSSTHHILPGPANIYLNDGYVAKASIPYVPPKDTFACSLGPDRHLRLEYTHTAEKKARATSMYAAKEETTTHTIKIKVTNNRSTPVGHLFLRDMLPTADDDRVKIVLVSPSQLIDAGDKTVDVAENLKIRWRKVKDGQGEKVGWVEWLCANIAEKGVVEVEMKCEVTAPSDMIVLDRGTYALFKTNPLV